MKSSFITIILKIFAVEWSSSIIQICPKMRIITKYIKVLVFCGKSLDTFSSCNADDISDTY